MAANLRSRQKLQRREQMLVAARELFIERGYSRTKMDAIADRAGVGVATVYTYFSTKEGVFAELARMDMGELRTQGEAVLEAAGDDPVESVLALLAVYAKVREYISYAVIRDFTLGARREGPIREVAGWVHDWQVAQLAAAMERARDAGRLADGLSVGDAALIICDLLERYYDRAMSVESDTRAYRRLRRQVKLLFEPWLG